MTGLETPYSFDEISNLWIQPFSAVISCLFPVEYVYGEWFWWQGENKARHCDPEDISCSLSSDLEAGSRVEGFCIPRFVVAKSDKSLIAESVAEKIYWQPDLDVMSECEPFIVEEEKIVPIFTAEHMIDNPRYAKLRLTQEWKEARPRYKNTTFLNHTYLLPAGDHALTRNSQTSLKEPFSYDLHGPVRKLEQKGFPGFESDQTTVFKYPIPWPERAMDWLVRFRPNGWPSPELVQDIFERGCHLAPVGRGKRFGEPVEFLQYAKNPELAEEPKMVKNVLGQEEMTMDETEWRISFSLAENKLGQSMTPVQRQVLILMKMIKKFYFPELIVCSYHLKNILFWEREAREESFWREDNTAACLTSILDRLHECLEKRSLPHYIMPESNLLEGKDESELANAAAAVADIRKNLLQKTVHLLKRLHSMTYLSTTFLQDLDLQPHLVSIQDRDLSQEERTELLRSLLSLFVHKYKGVLASIQRMDDPDLQKLLLVPLYAYQSLLGRKLGELWFLKNCANEMKKSDEEAFTKFVEDEVVNLSPGKHFITDDFLALSLEFFTQMNGGKESSLLVGSSKAMELTKEVQYTLTREQFEEAKEPMKEVIGSVKRSDLKKVENKLTGMLKGRLDTITMEDIEAMFNEEMKTLLEGSGVKFPHE